jgi:hypothetical protein
MQKKIEVWRTLTNAEILSASEFESLKFRARMHVVGVTGFSGQWSQKKLDGDAGLSADSASAREKLEAHLIELKGQYGSRLVVSSGATMEGVPKIIYETCEKLKIAAMGVTSEKAFAYPLGKMNYLIVQGADWGQESETFLATSDEILMLGGGGQAGREAVAASKMGKPVTVFQGYKGSADQMSAVDLPNAKFILR